MKLDLPEKFVLFDLEYTAWEDSKEHKWSRPGEYKEVIQIGAIRVAGFLEDADFCEYVRPVKNPQLSEFIIDFTGITQADVDKKGLTFEEALSRFLQFVQKSPAYCWGIDTEVLEGNSALLGGVLQLPRSQFQNLKPIVVPLLEKAGIDERKYSSGTLIQAFGTSTRRAHDAVNDMRNLLDALNELQKV